MFFFINPVYFFSLITAKEKQKLASLNQICGAVNRTTTSDLTKSYTMRSSITFTGFTSLCHLKLYSKAHFKF